MRLIKAIAAATGLVLGIIAIFGLAAVLVAGLHALGLPIPAAGGTVAILFVIGILTALFMA